MADDTDTRTPATETPTTPAAGGEPAFLARARRILAGDIRPEDYLPVTPEVEAGVKLDLAFAAEHIRKQFEAGRIPAVFEVSPETAIRQRNERLLSFHHGGQNIACIEDEKGVIVLAVGLDQTGALIEAIPYKLRKDVGFGTPLPDNVI
jgi:hypothetical protein